MTTNVIQKYNIQRLGISKDWEIVRNIFFDIDPNENIQEDDKYDSIYSQEDLMYLTKDNYHLDLGWYGYDNLTNDKTGFCIHLFRGDNWNNVELLEKLRSKDKQVIVKKINEFIISVDNGEYEEQIGYKVDENDLKNKNDFSIIENYTVRQEK